MKKMSHPADNLFYIDRKMVEEIKDVAGMCSRWQAYLDRKLRANKDGRININLHSLYTAIRATKYNAQFSLSYILYTKYYIELSLRDLYNSNQSHFNSTTFNEYALKSARNTMDMLLAVAKRRGLTKQ